MNKIRAYNVLSDSLDYSRNHENYTCEIKIVIDCTEIWNIFRHLLSSQWITFILLILLINFLYPNNIRHIYRIIYTIY